MSNYLDFENPKFQKGYKLFRINRESAKENIGKTICYVRSCDVDQYRGYVYVKYGVIESVYRNSVLLENGNSFRINEILEAGIKI